MKHISVIALLILVNVGLHAQDSLSYQDLKNGNVDLSQGHEIEVYNSESGTIIRKNDAITIQQASGATDNFSTIVMGNYSYGGGLLSRPTPITNGWSKSVGTVTDIKIFRAGRRGPYQAAVYLQTDLFSGKAGQVTVLDIDRAEKLEEIKSQNALLTREEAIQKLKELKDLLDLGLLTEEEYDEALEKYRPIIQQ